MRRRLQKNSAPSWTTLGNGEKVWEIKEIRERLSNLVGAHDQVNVQLLADSHDHIFAEHDAGPAGALHTALDSLLRIGP
jgi:hypothetical protein